eukprot:TRINITY_DN32371_c0_g1_i1.p2 TRINITY_DN32371_c0_g1~~TRINITY_DN32371_c0_g1_i1.p2  ORF type:complete len:154 (+),score=25.36 TRINITY_DN32371_c0_g1_i1:50-511(+)
MLSTSCVRAVRSSSICFRSRTMVSQAGLPNGVAPALRPLSEQQSAVVRGKSAQRRVGVSAFAPQIGVVGGLVGADVDLNMVGRSLGMQNASANLMGSEGVWVSEETLRGTPSDFDFDPQGGMAGSPVTTDVCGQALEEIWRVGGKFLAVPDDE